MSLLDRLVPTSALRWGRLDNGWFLPPDRPPGTLGASVTPRPDPAAAWGEADRRAEDR